MDARRVQLYADCLVSEHLRCTLRMAQAVSTAGACRSVMRRASRRQEIIGRENTPGDAHTLGARRNVPGESEGEGVGEGEKGAIQRARRVIRGSRGAVMVL